MAEPTTTHVLTTTENNTKLCKAVDNVTFHKKIKKEKGVLSSVKCALFPSSLEPPLFITAFKEKRLLSEALLVHNEQETCSLRSDKFFSSILFTEQSLAGIVHLRTPRLD